LLHGSECSINNNVVRKLAFITLMLMLTATAAMKAQLLFCGNYTDTGEPMEVSERWNLGEKGGYVYMYYSNKNKVIKTKTLNVVVKKMISGSYLSYDKKPMEIQDKKTWGVIDYHFTESGSYQVSIEEPSGKELSRSIAIIMLKGSAQEKEMNENPDQSYYKATLTFCTAITDDAPQGIGSTFTTGYIYLFVQNDRPILTDSLTIKYLRRLKDTDPYTLFDTRSVTTVKSSNSVYFKHTFNEGGDYMVEAYNGKNAKVASAHVTILWQKGDFKNDPDASYYTSTLTFCKSLDKKSNPVGVKSRFGTGSLYMYLKNDKPLLTDSMSVMIYKRPEGHKTYDEFYDSQKFGIDGTINATYFTWVFKDPGDYSVEIFNRKPSKMGGGTVSIKGGEIEDPDQSYYHSKLTFCTSINEEGKEVGLGNSFDPGKVYIFLQNDMPLISDSITVKIYKKSDVTGKYDQFYDSKKYGIKGTLEITYFPWNFDDPGDYSVEIYNPKSAKMGAGFVTIKGTDPTGDSKDPDRTYYNGTISFCENIVDGYEKNIGTSFKSGDVYIVLRNDKPLATDSIIVDVQKKAYNSDNYTIFMSSKNYGISATSKATYFSLNFNEAGQFKVEIFNRRMQKISEGIVTIH
jgi:hypothetical protein